MSVFDFLKDKEIKSKAENSLEYSFVFLELYHAKKEKKEPTAEAFLLSSVVFLMSVVEYVCIELAIKIDPNFLNKVEYKHVNTVKGFDRILEFKNDIKSKGNNHELVLAIRQSEQRDRREINLNDAIDFLRKENVLSEEEFMALDKARRFRNQVHLTSVAGEKFDGDSVNQIGFIFINILEDLKIYY